MKRVLSLIAVVLALASCSAAKHITDNHYQSHNEATYNQTHKTDSIYIRDSIFIKEKGDTVYKYVEKWRVRDRIIHDTLIVSQTDTVFVDVTKVEEVERELTTWQKVKMRGFWVYTFILVVALIVLALKYKSVLLGMLKKILPL